MNKLDPKVLRTAWSPQEEAMLVQAHRMHGNKWSEIARVMEGR